MAKQAPKSSSGSRTSTTRASSTMRAGTDSQRRSGKSSLTRVPRSVRRRLRSRTRPNHITFPLLLRKMAELTLMASFIGAVIAYQFSFPNQIMVWLQSWMLELNDGVFPSLPSAGAHPGAWIVKDLMPMLTAGNPVPTESTFARLYGGLPVLELKSTVWLLCGLLLVCVHLFARLYERASGTPIFPADLSPRRRRRNPWRLIPLFCAMGFLIWAFVSVSTIGWAPQPPLQAVEILAGEDGDPSAVTGGSYQSFVSWFQVLAGVLFFFVAEDIIRTRRLVYKILGLVCGLGLLAGLISVLTHARVPGLSSIWIEWGPQDYRNDVGGIIGHNTAVSSFLMAPMLILWTVFATRSRGDRWKRVLLAAAMALMALTLIMAQSRAVIPILFVSFGALLVLLARRASIKPGIGFVVGVPLVLTALLLTQFIRADLNPVYRRNLPLATRITHLTGDHLLTETRLRILAASMPVIRDAPVTGTGWGTFHYVFPQAQGEFYQEHPRSIIGPTDKKTFRAHNEYLQTLFETGLPGLLLAVIPLAVILLSGWRSMKGSFRQQHIALQVAIVIALVAMMTHAVFDFPFRIAPLASQFILLLAVWSAGDRLWVIRTRPMDERRIDRPGEADLRMMSTSRLRELRTAEQLETRRMRRLRLPRPATAGLLVAGVLLLATYIGAGARAAEWFAAQQIATRAAIASDLWESPRDGGSPRQRATNAYLTESTLEAIDSGLRLSPLHGELRYQRARFLQNAATDIWGSPPPQGAQNAALRRAQDIATLTSQSVQELDISLANYLFHGSWRSRAITNYVRFLGLRGVSGESSKAIADAIRDMDRAVRMNPGDPQAISTLITWLENFQPAAEERIIELYGLLMHYHEPYFMEEILFDITTLMSLNEYGEAYDRLSVIAAADEDNVMLQQMLMATALRAGRPELSRMWANRLPEGELTQPELLQAEYYLYGIDPRVPETQRLSNAEEMIARADTSDPDARRRARMLSLIVELRQARSAGNQPRVDDVIRRIGLLAQIPHEVRADAAQILKGAFNDHDAAVQLLRDRVTDESMDDNWMPHALLARTLVERWEGKLEDLRGRQRDALEAGQEVPVVEDPLMREDLAEAAEHLEIALEQLTAGSARPFLSRRLAEVTAYLEGLPSQRPAPEPMVLRNPQSNAGDDSP